MSFENEIKVYLLSLLFFNIKLKDNTVQYNENKRKKNNSICIWYYHLYWKFSKSRSNLYKSIREFISKSDVNTITLQKLIVVIYTRKYTIK